MSNVVFKKAPGSKKVSAREIAALSYWRASQRLIQDRTGLRLSEAQANVVLVNQALDGSWPKLKSAAVITLLMARRKRELDKDRQKNATLSNRRKSR
jgi:hypothetical protein